MSILAEFMILSGADNRPPMLEKHMYDSWKSRMELYMQNREHVRMILESVEHGPLIWPMIEENGVIRTKKYEELFATKTIQADCDLKATNIILQGLPSNVYSLERECKLYDAFDKFAHIKGESLHQYYLRFTQLINDMNIYKMKLEQFQVHTKFLNSLPSEWSKFVTYVKLVRDLHTTNFDQLHAYLEQHKLHANEVLNQQTHLAEFPQIDSGLAVPVFKQGDDPIDAINKMMSFLANISGIGGNNSGQQRVVKCFNCQGEGHMARQCLKPKRKKDATWFRDKALLVEAQGFLNKEELEFLADPGVAEAVQDTNSFVQQDVMILSVFEQLSYQKVKELDNIVCKMGQSAQTVHMLMKPQVFYDNNLKQALGFQNPFYLKKAQQIRPTLYDGSVIAKETNVISIADSEETLMHEEESRLKMLLKQNFGKRFVPQQELSDEQAFRLQTSHPNTDQSASSPIKTEAPQELPKCLKLEAELIKQHNMVETDEYNRLSKSFSKLEQHCISLELAMRLNKEIFQKNNTSVNQTEPSFDQLFELNNFKAELQAKDTTIEKLKANIKRLNKTSTTNNVKNDIDEIETINIKLEHRAKEHAESLVNKLNPKSVEITDLNAQLQEKVFVITTLKNVLRKFKGKDIVDNANPRVRRSTKSSRLKSIDNTKNDRILQISSSTQKKNKVEDHSRIVKSSLNKSNYVVEQSGNATVQHSKLIQNSEANLLDFGSSKHMTEIELSSTPILFTNFLDTILSLLVNSGDSDLEVAFQKTMCVVLIWKV
ncbi:retrovirus-related pol polyprotein from transposon TNT 1-94 [Tanacetum coccineum]